MLIPYTATAGYSHLLDVLSDSAVVELDRLLAQIQNEPLEVQREAVFELLPALGQQYAGAASDISAEFFTELQDMNEVRKPIKPDVLPPVDPERWQSLAGWATSDRAFEQGGHLLMYSLLSGGLTRILSEWSADTIVGNAEAQGGMRAQRVPRPGCCAFCGMLASRYAEYKSTKSAGEVVGRGVPVGKGKGRGLYGRGTGLRPRGSRQLGQDFHDFCRCRIVAVTEKNEVELQATAEKYYESYADAYQHVRDGQTLRATEYEVGDGRTKNKYEWFDSSNRVRSSQDSTKDILAKMRQDLGVK